MRRLVMASATYGSAWPALGFKPKLAHHYLRQGIEGNQKAALSSNRTNRAVLLIGSSVSWSCGFRRKRASFFFPIWKKNRNFAATQSTQKGYVCVNLFFGVSQCACRLPLPLISPPRPCIHCSPPVASALWLVVSVQVRTFCTSAPPACS